MTKRFKIQVVGVLAAMWWARPVDAQAQTVEPVSKPLVVSGFSRTFGVLKPDLGVQVAPEPATRASVGVAEGVSIEQLVAVALERALELQASRTDVEAARARVRQAELRPNPMVMSERRGEAGGTDQQSMLNVVVPLDLFRRTGRVTTAERTVDAVAQSLADRERLLASTVRQAAGAVLAAARRLAVLEELIGVNRRMRDLLAARVAEGASPALDRDRAEVEVRRLDADRALQVARVETAMIELKAIVGLPPDAPLALRSELETVVQADADDATVATTRGARLPAVDQRPDVREAAARVRLFEAQVGQTRREGRFDVSLYGTYMRMDSGFSQRAFNAANELERIRGVFHNLSLGATVMVPLFNRNQGAIAAAEAERIGAERLHAARQLAARAEIAAATRRDEQARRAVDAYASGTRALARQNLEVVRQSYELGRNPLFDVFAEQRRYLELENAYTEALGEAYEARTALRRARGEL